MKKKLLKVVSLALVLILALPFCVSAFTVEELELMSGGTIIDSTDEYYILDIDGETQYVKEDGTIYGEYVIISYQKVDIEPFDNGETDEFFGVKVAKVKALSEVELTDGMTIYPYVVVLQDVFAGAEAEAIWAANESIRSVTNNSYTGLPATYIDGDVNADGVVDAFDCLIVKGIYFDSYEATEDELTRADINGDGEIDMFDYLKVKAIYFEQ